MSKRLKISLILLLVLFFAFPVISIFKNGTFIIIYGILLVVNFFVCFIISKLDQSIDKENLKYKYNITHIKDFDTNSVLNSQNIKTIHFKIRYILREMRQVEDGFVSQIISADENFSKHTFKQKVIGCFLKLQNAKIDNDINLIRPFVSKEFLEKYDFNDNFILNNIEVLGLFIIDYRVYEGMQIIKLELSVKYELKDSNNKFASTYHMELFRKDGTLTSEKNDIAITNCPNCGSPNDITTTGKCKYCGSYINNEEYSWTLNDLKYYDEM